MQKLRRKKENLLKRQRANKRSTPTVIDRRSTSFNHALPRKLGQLLEHGGGLAGQENMLRQGEQSADAHGQPAHQRGGAEQKGFGQNQNDRVGGGVEKPIFLVGEGDMVKRCEQGGEIDRRPNAENHKASRQSRERPKGNAVPQKPMQTELFAVAQTEDHHHRQQRDPKGDEVQSEQELTVGKVGKALGGVGELTGSKLGAPHQIVHHLVKGTANGFRGKAGAGGQVEGVDL